ncbi:MAG: hypothetical protein KDD70_12015, partial [Bdellovibrionales bacterium]|nr:hypothetical protein [Bdellovibrionales bacterium]
LKQVERIDDALDKEADDIQDDERKLALAKAKRAALSLKQSLASNDRNTAIGRLADSAKRRRQAINEAVGQARTTARLTEDKGEELRERVKAQVAQQKRRAELDSLLGS